MNTPKIPRLAIIMDGGIIQGVVADSEVDLLVVDYDIEDLDFEEDELVKVPQIGSDGNLEGSADAYVFSPFVEVSANHWLDAAFKAADHQNIRQATEGESEE